MNELVAKHTEIIETNINNAWDLLGNRFGDVALWAGNFKVSEAGGEAKFDGLDYSHRVITNDDQKIVQVLDVFDTENRSLEYHITEGMPKPAAKAIGIWSVKATDEGKTEATFEFRMVTKPFVNEEMAAKIQMGLGMGAKKFAKEFKYYLENNASHPNNNGE